MPLTCADDDQLNAPCPSPRRATKTTIDVQQLDKDGHELIAANKENFELVMALIKVLQTPNK